MGHFLVDVLDRGALWFLNVEMDTWNQVDMWDLSFKKYQTHHNPPCFWQISSFNGLVYSGKSTGNHGFSHENNGFFPVNFRQAIDSHNGAIWHLHGPDPVTGNESALEYTFGYFRDKEGHLRRGFPGARKFGHQGRNREVEIRASKSNK